MIFKKSKTGLISIKIISIAIVHNNHSLNFLYFFIHLRKNVKFDSSPQCESHLPLYRIKKCGICPISCPKEISTRTWFEVDTYISFSLVRISHTSTLVRSDPSIILTLTRHAWLLTLVISSQCISETKSKANSERDTRCPCFTCVVIRRKQIKVNNENGVMLHAV